MIRSFRDKGRHCIRAGAAGAAGWGFLLLVAVLASGCGLGGKPAYLVRQYILEYPPPAVEKGARTDDLIRVERFSVAKDFDTLSMTYQEGPFRRGSDPYNRWRVPPNDMVTDYLVRDLRKANHFRAVFSYNESEETRYLLQGRVEEFLELGEKEGRRAALSLNITLQDLTKRETGERIVFQRDYRMIEPLDAGTPEGLARGMSRAMERLSSQLLSDIAQVLKDR